MAKCNTSVPQSRSQHDQAAVWATGYGVMGVMSLTLVARGRLGDTSAAAVRRHWTRSHLRASGHPCRGQDTWDFSTGYLIIWVASWVKTCWRETAPHPLIPLILYPLICGILDPTGSQLLKRTAITTKPSTIQ